MRWFAGRGHPVTGVDNAPHALQALGDLVATGRAETVLADIENAPWPLLDAGRPRRFGAVVVTHYLWRPLLPVLLDSLASGGVLLYETFAHGNASVGKPSRPEFLLQPQELLAHCRALRVVAFEDGFLEEPPRYLQRIAAVKAAQLPPGPDDGAPEAPRYLLAC